MNIGQMNTLRVLRFTSVGAYLGDEQDNDVLLPNKYLTDDLTEGDDMEVFVYRDSEDRVVATTETPLLSLGTMAFLEIKEVNFYGAFANWGLEKDLMIPFKEQHQSLEEGKFYLTCLLLDQATDRVYGTTKVNKYYKKCDDPSILNKELDILIGDRTDLGVKVIIEGNIQGLIYSSDIHKELRRGQTTKGYVYNVREDGKLDVRLEPSGYQKIDEFSDKIYAILQRKKSLQLTDKSSPEEIREAVGMSKKSFKQAIGKLYKQRLITLGESSIDLAEN